MSDICKIHVVSKNDEIITIPSNAPFGTLRIRFEEEDGRMIEFPLVTKMLIDIFINNLYCHKDLIKS